MNIDEIFSRSERLSPPYDLKERVMTRVEMTAQEERIPEPGWGKLFTRPSAWATSLVAIVITLILVSDIGNRESLDINEVDTYVMETVLPIYGIKEVYYEEEEPGIEKVLKNIYLINGENNA